VNANAAEVASEARLEKGQGVRIKRLAGRAQHFMNNGRSLRDVRLRSSQSRAVKLALVLFRAGVALAIRSASALAFAVKRGYSSHGDV